MTTPIVNPEKKTTHCAECEKAFEHNANRKRVFCSAECSLKNQNRRYYQRRKAKAEANG